LKDPEKEFAEVLISAYDSCGRKCKAFCRNENGDTSKFHECAGPKKFQTPSVSICNVEYNQNIKCLFYPFLF
jgi:hypothetical protein